MTGAVPDPAATPPQSVRLVNLPNALTVLRVAVVPLPASTERGGWSLTQRPRACIRLR